MTSMGEERARARTRRMAGVWRDTLIGAVVGGVALGLAAGATTPAVRWPLLAVAATAMAWALWVGTIRYFRVIDEQERFAAYWSGMIGLYAYVFLFGLRGAASRLGLNVPVGEHGTFWIVLAVTMGAFLWKRYR